MKARNLRRMAAQIPANLERKEGTGTATEDKLLLEMKDARTQLLEAIKTKADKSVVDGLQSQVDAIDVKLADRHMGSGAPGKALVDLLKEDESVQRLMRDRKGTAIINLKGADVVSLLERKATITSDAVGAQTTGVLRIDRMAGITQEARQALRLRNLLTARQTSLQIIDYVRVQSPMAQSSPQQESSAKAEQSVTFTSESEKVQTIASWVPASKQVLQDMDELASFINDSLMYYTNLAEELQMLTGSGAGTDLNGLITQATAFDTGLLSGPAGWTRIDVIAAAIEQLATSKEIDPTFVVLNPTDWWRILRTKDSQGRYILGDPASVAAPRLWNLDVVPTNNMTSGEFLVGSGNPEATVIRDRMEAQIEVATQHADYFTKNLVAIRCEKRVALVTRRPASFVTGSFTTSPA